MKNHQTAEPPGAPQGTRHPPHQVGWKTPYNTAQTTSHQHPRDTSDEGYRGKVAETCQEVYVGVCFIQQTTTKQTFSYHNQCAASLLLDSGGSG
ncbi:hypothetical protein AALO_G00083360 [Alosa alosa]|uniref:Uncharacterized protein n=1 Tax=Alosa alosa TaxID=278164 RepID=A0AAV6GXW3_9TELE|nr:hypothetical protein AALO_G00083360 [Alosa alosa]